MKINYRLQSVRNNNLNLRSRYNKADGKQKQPQIYYSFYYAVNN